MKHLTIAEISRRTDIPESTLRYRSKLFKKYSPTVGRGRKKRFEECCVERFKLIDKLFTEGLKTEDISIDLEKKYGPEVILETSTLKGINKISISKSSKQTKSSSIDIELLAPILKVIENQEIIINELRIQNKMLKAPKRKGVLSRIFR